MNDSRGITMAAAKYILEQLTKDQSLGINTDNLIASDLITQHDLWIVDGWSHVGYVIVTCLENPKLVDSINKGNLKVIDTIMGKTIRSANMTVDPNVIRELVPLVIKRWFN